MQRTTLTIIFAILLLLISNDLGTSAMNDHRSMLRTRIPLLHDTDKRNTNGPNPNLPNLSVQGKEVEEELAKHYHPTNTKAVGTSRAFKLWWRHGQEEIQRNTHHRKMNNYANDIKEYEKYKQSTMGKAQSKIPMLRKMQDKKGVKLNEKYNNAKQERDEHRQTMRDIANDANVHKKAGNFIDHDVAYVTQPNLSDSYEIGFLSDGRHISSPRNPKLTRSRSAT
jgi:hypothetical protein